MLTLLVTALATAYFVIPELLSRFILNVFLTRRVLTSPKSEELMRAALWAIVPLSVAWWTRNYWFLWCCRYPPGAASAVGEVFGGLFSQKIFESSPQIFYGALPTFIGVNACLLLRTLHRSSDRIGDRRVACKILCGSASQAQELSFGVENSASSLNASHF